MIGVNYCDECGGSGYHLEGCITYEEHVEDSGQSAGIFEAGAKQESRTETENPSIPAGPPELLPILRRTAVDLLTWAAHKIDPKQSSKP